jgi:hypothetical protein
MSVCRCRAPLLACFVAASALIYVFLAVQPSSLVPVHRRLLLSELPNNSSASFLAHQVSCDLAWVSCSSHSKAKIELFDPLLLQCLWSPAETSAVATAEATASGSGSAVAIATASAGTTTFAPNSKLLLQTPPAGICSLNPSYFFSLSASGRRPAQDNEK